MLLALASVHKQKTAAVEQRFIFDPSLARSRRPDSLPYSGRPAAPALAAQRAPPRERATAFHFGRESGRRALYNRAVVIA